ncbi:EamA family transporter [Nonomuraea sp. LPB2021202275-12-8]|uniref:EamA family transporter n=1 Tax=Nonomuraea sp. LPB2021202275-12-8 TaxID=3120159 RepID=UPI00300CC7BF
MKNGPVAVVAAAVLWGTAGTAGLLVSADSIALAAARLVIGGAALALFAGAGIGRALRRPSLLLAAVAVAAYQLCFFAAVARTGVAIGTVVAIGSGPVFTGLLSWAMHGQRPSVRWVLATAAAVAGCVALIAGGGAQAGGQVLSGVLFALLGGLLYAFYAVSAARAIGRGAPSGAVMGVLFGGAAVIMLPVLLWQGLGWLAEPRGLLAVLYLGLGTTALSYFLYGRGLRTTPVATAATLALAEPAVAALLGLVVLGERLAPISIAGLGLLAVSLVVVALPEAKSSPAVGAREVARATGR